MEYIVLVCLLQLDTNPRTFSSPRLSTDLVENSLFCISLSKPTPSSSFHGSASRALTNNLLPTGPTSIRDDEVFGVTEDVMGIETLNATCLGFNLKDELGLLVAREKQGTEKNL